MVTLHGFHRHATNIYQQSWGIMRMEAKTDTRFNQETFLGTSLAFSPNWRRAPTTCRVCCDGFQRMSDKHCTTAPPTCFFRTFGSKHLKALANRQKGGQGSDADALTVTNKKIIGGLSSWRGEFTKNPVQRAQKSQKKCWFGGTWGPISNVETQGKNEADDIPKEGDFQQLVGNYGIWLGTPS